ncbi:MAG: MFS transporter [Magnetococcales bacterium]|nr:MFS transporter [Magnetococcales bacterium]NGZ04868.1 MFS transporter [Magnetococcales bacterium]
MNPHTTQSALLRSRRFLPLFITQFLGALNDNVVKNALVVLLTFHASSWTTLPPEVLANLAAGIFILPFFLFSATAGQLADKVDKARLARLVKLLEILIVLVTGLGFALHRIEVLFIGLFLLGGHSTLFGPVKYAILPQHLHDSELIGGNALIEAGTFVAILVGTLLGGLLAGHDPGGHLITVAGLTIAIVGYLASRTIPAAPPPDDSLRIQLNFVRATWHNLLLPRQQRAIFLSILGISWFWLYGALFLAQFPAYTRNVLGGDESAVTLLLATFTIGISIGSLLCERLSAGRVELGLVPFGSLGLTLFGLDLAWASPAVSDPAGALLSAMVLLTRPEIWRILVDLILLGTFGGFFIVPLYALVQQRSPADCRARMIAANNIYNALFMVAGALAAATLLGHGLTIPELFAIAALGNAAVALYIYSLLPEFLMRFLVWLVVRGRLRLQVAGAELIPASGPALLLFDQTTPRIFWLLMAACYRPLRCVVPNAMPHNWLGRFVWRASGAIRQDASADATIRSALVAGELLAIPEDLLLPAVGPDLLRLHVTVRISSGARIGLRFQPE